MVNRTPAVSLFPLRLSPFEEYMYKDSHPAFPMFFSLRLRRQDGWDAGRLQRAARSAVERHPLLRCTLERLGRNRHQWVRNDGWYPLVEPVALQGTRTFPPTPRLDLVASPGLRLNVAQHVGTGDLFAHFHHACCDGMGALQFLEDLLVAYDVDGDLRELRRRRPSTDPEQLRRRTGRAASWTRRIATLHHHLVGLQRAARFFLRRPDPLRPQTWPELRADLPADHPAVMTRCIPADGVESLRGQARRHGVTSYEILLRDLYLTLHEFRALAPGTQDCGWLRLNVPFNLREAMHDSTPAANIVSMIFLDREPRQLQDPKALLQGIHREMAHVKKYEAKYAFVRFARLLSCLPWSYDLLALSKKCHATALLTNLGPVLHRLPVPYQQGRAVVGGKPIVDFEIVPPFRPLTQLAFSLSNYAGALSILLHYDARVVPAELAEAVIDALAQRVTGSAEWTPASECVCQPC